MINEIGSPTQNIIVIRPMMKPETVIGRCGIRDNGSTTKFINKYTATP